MPVEPDAVELTAFSEEADETVDAAECDVVDADIESVVDDGVDEDNVDVDEDEYVPV